MEEALYGPSDGGENANEEESKRGSEKGDEVVKGGRREETVTSYKMKKGVSDTIG